MNVAFGINLAGPISNYALSAANETGSLSPAATNPTYTHIFLAMTVVAIIITVIFAFLLKQINHMVSANKVQMNLQSELE